MMATLAFNELMTNENHWLLLAVLSLRKTVITIDFLSYEKNQFWISLCFFKKNMHQCK